jgi:hypothetical protein
MVTTAPMQIQACTYVCVYTYIHTYTEGKEESCLQMVNNEIHGTLFATNCRPKHLLGYAASPISCYIAYSFIVRACVCLCMYVSVCLSMSGNCPHLESYLRQFLWTHAFTKFTIPCLSPGIWHSRARTYSRALLNNTPTTKHPSCSSMTLSSCIIMLSLRCFAAIALIGTPLTKATLCTTTPSCQGMTVQRLRGSNVLHVCLCIHAWCVCHPLMCSMQITTMNHTRL